MLAIFKREFRSYFTGMMGPLLTAFLAVGGGLYFYALNLTNGLTDFGYYTLYRTIILFIFYVPVLTMRSFAEERKNRTDQLLLTSPVSVGGIVLGKFFAMCAVFALPCVLYAGMILVLWGLGAGAAAVGGAFACLLCYYLLGCAAIAIGEYISSLTENQIIAAVGSLAAILAAYLMPSLQTLYSTGSTQALVIFLVVLAAAAAVAGLRSKSFALGCGVFCAGTLVLGAAFMLRPAWLVTAFSAVLDALCLFVPFEDFVGLSFSVPALVYYLTAAALFLFLTAQGVEKRRWN